MKTTKNTRVLMLLAIALMALISMQGCGLNDMDSKDVDLSPDEQMIKDGTHPILGSWAIYALVDADGNETIVDWPNARTAVFNQDKTFEGKGCNYFFGHYELLKENKIYFHELYSTEMYCIDDSLRQSLDQTIYSIDSFKIINDQLLLFYDGDNYMLLNRTIEEP